MSRFTFALRSIVFPLVVVAIIFVAAGRWDLPFVWAVAGVMCVLFLALAVFADPDLLRERQAPGPGNRDRLTRGLGAVLLVGHWILAGLDVGRFEWSLVPWEIQLAGVIGYASALMVNFWAVRANPFYSSVVRVQTERGQRAIADGPYRYVRHPGYAATLTAMMCGGVALGSWVAMLPILGFAVLFVRRTLIEDRMLQQELAGYAEYAATVRYRLIPGVF